MLPTSRTAVRDMLDLADVPGADLVVELGPGTGVYTGEILARLRPDARLLALEIDPHLAELLTQRFDDPRLQVVCDSAENLHEHLRGERADIVVSGLPYTSLEPELRQRILDQIPRALRLHGVALVLQYSPFVQAELRRRFPHVRRRVSLLNFPPAFLFGCSAGAEVRAEEPTGSLLPLTRRTWSEGRRYIVPSAALGAALLLKRRRSGWLALGAAAGFTAFFRDPERPLTAEPGVVYAAADGVVRSVDESVDEPWLPGGRAVRIATFLNLHNVHVNRSPVEGKVAEMEFVEGGFAPALFSRAGHNTRTRIAIDGPSGRVVVVPMAGLIARKISSWIQPGDQVETGQRIGLIHLSSRTDVLLPEGGVHVLVRPGDRVRAGITPLARYRPGG
ncbi:phosphatidylserine decarboxylase precursor-related protein [Kineococcus xinjiangensis]|uniref:Phosphatidylserine decarboxylase-related protein n=1 Tax=Kineococcus xinjiangensis TaxID=512762 RepID=A0A2S6IU30_9ACTN|nr:phosphatidylserine decarboxylase [Kineococcus xinjiangensis]PPK97762.1 phosphatidylserine decarboxylase precursor-related protein [Kineococcus xinjiangensis]